MNDREVSRHGDFEVATKPAIRGRGFIAWAKMGAISGSCPLDEPGAHVWFEFGPTRDAAILTLLQELGLAE